ncbi:MAG: PadR family transcriptional regulator [Nitrososphaerota archaeon]|nr:PadR family transcriptional regulator [Candidatus Bathyarchaeota archaeon]MDW8023482.1 PadR family transcriptional regulator [Nitrososphaerota archaeon]
MNNSKEVQIKLMKGLLDLIVLQFLSTSPMHGYQIITKIRKTFGVYFGPSTVYPLLNSLEKSGYVKSEWDMKNDRPRKVYRLTVEGQNFLNFTEYSLNLICKKIGASGIQKESLMEEDMTHAALTPLIKNLKDKTAHTTTNQKLSAF